MASPVCCNETAWEQAGARREIFRFEKEFDFWSRHQWMVDNWTLSFYFVGAYLVLIYAGQWYMRSRPPFQLRGPLFLWNVSLAAFSIFATSRVVPELAYFIRANGFHHAVCEMGSEDHKQAYGLWTWLFVLSKVVELGDTAFVVLRKQKLIFLHWYHHVTVLLFVWYGSAYLSSTCRWFMTVNLLVHSFMYSYYALKVLRVPIPRPVSMAITAMQLVQMAAGVFLTGYSYWTKSRGIRCCVHDEIITMAVSMYLTYLLLFSNFFIKVYAGKGPESKLERAKKRQ